MTDIESRDIVAALLVNAAGIDSRLAAIADGDAFLGYVEAQGVLTLVAEACAGHPALHPALRAALASHAQAAAVIDLVKEAELKTVLAHLQARDVDYLLMKGAHLAHALYPRSDLRPRLDTDILVRPAERTKAAGVLAECGYARADAQQEGDLLMHQTTFVKTAGAVRHIIDLHWRALNPQAFAGVFDVAALFERAIPLPRLSPGARGLDVADALLLALVHRVAHHRTRPLIWTYDIHLLAERCDEQRWQRLLESAHEAGVGAIARHGLEDARTCFGSRVPDWILSESGLASETDSVSAAYLEPASKAQLVLHEFRALPGWPERFRLALQYAFPRAHYMRTVYAPDSRLPLAALYVVRAWKGGLRWLAKS